ncbi:uncharacterized protein ACO6RY_15447 [Pungitius sinensis]
MLMRSLFLNGLLFQLLGAGAGFCSVRPPVSDMDNATGGNWTGVLFALIPTDFQPNCTAGFQVFVNSTGSKLNEGDEVTLTCVHNLPTLNLTFGWTMNGKEIEKARNDSKLILKKVFERDAGTYVCIVHSVCGEWHSPPHEVTVANQSVVILIICGVSALVMVLIIGLAMKYKLKRDAAKHRERRQQREMRQNGPPSFIHT